MAAFTPTVRLGQPGLVAMTAALGSLPTAITLALGGHDFFAPLVLAGLVAGSAPGWSVDDPSAELLASMPIGAPLRAAMRIGATAALSTFTFLGVLAAVGLGPGLPAHVGDRWPEAAAAGAIALAVGLLGSRRGERGAGAAAVTAGVLGSAFVGVLSMRMTQLPSFMVGAHHGRWWLIAGAGIVVALYAGRDPAHR